MNKMNGAATILILIVVAIAHIVAAAYWDNIKNALTPSLPSTPDAAAACTKVALDAGISVENYNASTDTNGRNGNRKFCDLAAAAISAYNDACDGVTTALPALDCDSLFD